MDISTIKQQRLISSEKQQKFNIQNWHANKNE